jgi:hypothetical protein
MIKMSLIVEGLLSILGVGICNHFITFVMVLLSYTLEGGICNDFVGIIHL